MANASEQQSANQTEVGGGGEVSFRGFADSMPQIVWVAASCGGIEYVSQRWVQYTGVDQAESVKRGLIDFFHPDDRDEVLRTWGLAAQSKLPFRIEARIRGASGQYRWHLCEATLRDWNGSQASRWVGTSIDIDDCRRREAELCRARVAAEVATMAKTTFLANISHEIRTPLGIMIGFTDLLLASGDEGSERTSWLRMIKRNGEVLHGLINDLLDLSKVEANRLDLDMASLSLVEFVRDTAAVLSFKAKGKGIDLRFSCDSALPQVIQTDAARLRQIFLNVVGNAIKFTDHGCVDVVLRYKEVGDGRCGRLECEVRDTGIGLSLEQAQRIWEPFAQAECSTARKYGGTGLGLTLARRLALALGGDLVLAHSRQGEGSVFVFYIGASRVDTEGHGTLAAGCDLLAMVSAEPAPGECGSALPSVPIAGSNYLLSGVSVLVVDDSLESQVLIRRLLEVAGAHVEMASDGVEGVSKAEAGHYDIVLMDIQMPGGLDGNEATAQLRHNHYPKPIVALTAHAMKADRDHFGSSGFSDYLVKPIDREVLVTTVAQYTRQSPTTPRPSLH